VGTIYLADFKFGMDRRRLRATGIPGTLWTAKNSVITRGGDLEAAKRFVPTYTLPAGQTFGLAEVRGSLWTFGSAPSVATPLGINYMQLSAPSGANMVRVLDARAANGKLYVIASYADGNTFHFYDGSRITDWDAVADGGFTFAVLADYMASLINGDANVSAASVSNTVVITARVPGTAFTISKSTSNNGSVSDQDITLTTRQANVPVIAEVLSSTAITFNSGTAGTITSLTINGVQLLSAPVVYAGSINATVTALAQGILNHLSTPNYTAAAVGNVVTISAAPGTGAGPNGFSVIVTATGDLNISAPNMDGGVTAQAGVAQVVSGTFIGTPEGADLFTVTINGVNYSSTGRASATGTSAFVGSKRVFSTAGSLIEFSALNAFNDFHSTGLANGTGFLNVANDAEGSERLVGLGRYLENQLAAMTRRNIRLYNLSADATTIALVQPVDNTGTIAARSVLGFGSIDLFYLADSGIRSLRPRDTTNAAFVEDIGTAIDTFVRAHIDTLSSAVYSRAVSVMEPRDDRFWLSIDGRIYVLSYFPNSSISAWTYFEPPAAITDFARVYDQLYARGGDTVYLYGGSTGLTYPDAGEMAPYIETPFISNTPPGRFLIEGYDQAAQGDWQVQCLITPNDETQQINIGTVSDITYGEDDISTIGRAPFIALNLTCVSGGKAVFANMSLHDNSAEKQA
jgi:hypothetical protein